MQILSRYKEYITMIIVWFTTVMIALVSYCATLWSSSAQELYSKANAANTEANSTYLEYFQKLSISEIQDIRWALIQNSVAISSTSSGEVDTELHDTEERYTIALEKTEKTMNDADSANEKGDTFSLLGFLYSIVLFLTSMIQFAQSSKAKGFYLMTSVILFLVVSISLFFLPFPKFPI